MTHTQIQLIRQSLAQVVPIFTAALRLPDGFALK
jgi:hypothetical protein